MVERKKYGISICLVNESLYIIIALGLLDEICEYGVDMLRLKNLEELTCPLCRVTVQ